MTDTMVISILKDLIYTTLKVAGPLLLVATGVGLIVSIFQATTQIQEQTLTFVPKVIAVALVGMLMASYIGNTVMSFTKRLFEIISNL